MCAAMVRVCGMSVESPGDACIRVSDPDEAVAAVTSGGLGSQWESGRGLLSP